MFRYLRRITLVTSDICGFILAYGLSYICLDHEFASNTFYQFMQLLGILALTFIICLFLFASRGHYSWRTPWWEQVKHVATIFFFALIINLLINYVALPILPAQSLISLTWFLSIFFVLVARLMGRKFLKKMNHWAIKTVVVGDTQSVIDTIIALKSEFYLTYNIHHVVLVGAKDSDVETFKHELPDIQIQTEMNDIERHSMIILCLGQDNQTIMQDYLIRIRNIGAKFAIVPPTSGFSLYGMSPQYFFGYNIVLMESQYQLRTFWGKTTKMLMDRLGALVGLFLLAPIFLIVYLKVRSDGGPAFYFQNRVGKDGKPFKCWKFRSMIVNADAVLKEILEKDPVAREEYAKDYKLKNDPRITAFGHFLRKSSLDEIPQLYNVLKGEMSLVGPRPVVKAEEVYYGDKFDQYMAVRPGITGLWQVSGRNDVTYDQRVALDTWYVQNWSVWTDIVIIFKTTFVVLYRKGAY